jgi:membrane-associated phospholipid phosphatase
MASAAAECASAPARLFKHPAHLLYAICGLELVGSVALALAFGFRAASVKAFLPQLYCALLVACGPLLRRIERPRLAGAFETVGFLYGQGFALVALLYPMTAIAAPFADAQLAAADRALGFDWPSLAQWVGTYPDFIRVLKAVYFSFGWQGAVILPALFLVRHPSHAWATILAANLALLLTLVVYPFLPAQGTFMHYGITPQEYPNMSVQVAWSFGPAIHAIRDEGARYITRELMVPFVSFPSYHAVAALLLSWAAWPVRKLRWPILLLNLCMAFSALIIGAHYLVDLIGGAVIASVSIVLAMRMLELVREPD